MYLREDRLDTTGMRRGQIRDMIAQLQDELDHATWERDMWGRDILEITNDIQYLERILYLERVLEGRAA